MDSIQAILGKLFGKTSKRNIKNNSAKEDNIPTIFRQGSYRHLYGSDLIMNWNITLACNYSCTYCFNTFDKSIDKQKFSTWDELQYAADQIISQDRSQYVFNIAGGEPTVHPELPRLIKYLDEHIGKKSQFILVSNASRSVDYYDKLLDMSVNNIAFNFSVHTEYAKIQHITDLVTSLANRVSINFSIMFHPERHEFVQEVINTFYELRKKYSFSFVISQLREPPSFQTVDRRYASNALAWMDEENIRIQDLLANAEVKSSFERKNTPLFIDILRKGKRELIGVPPHGAALRQNLLRYKNMWCPLGTSLISIEDDGTCYGAQCGIAKHRAPNGNIYTTNIFKENIFPFLIRCPKEHCTCRDNLAIPKFKEYREAEQFIASVKDRVFVKK